MMTPWERVTRELNHEEPDRLPWGGEGVSHPTADLVLGRPALTGMGGARRILRLHSEGRFGEARSRFRADVYDLARKLKIDLVQIPSLPPEEGRGPRFLSENQWYYEGSNPLQSVDGNLLTIEIDRSTGNRVQHTMEDLESLVNGMRASRSQSEEDAERRMEGAAALIRDVKTHLKAAAFYPVWNCFLTHPQWLPVFLKAFHTRPDIVARFERAQCRRAIAAGKAAIDAGADVIGIGGDLAYKHGPMISPARYREFILPHMRRESDAFHRKGGYSMIASDGNLMPIGHEYFIASGVDAAREIEPGPMDRATVKECFGDKVCLNGNVDCGATLGLRSPVDVVRETKECIELWSPGGGHIMSSSNTISPMVKPRNFIAMWKSIFRYGKIDHGT